MHSFNPLTFNPLIEPYLSRFGMSIDGGIIRLETPKSEGNY